MERPFKVGKCPNDSLALRNCVVVNPADLSPGDRYVSINTGSGENFLFTVEYSDTMAPGFLGVNGVQRKWALLSLNQEVLVTVVDGLKAAKRNMLMSADVDVGFVSKKTTTPNQFDAGEMSKRFVTLHNKHLLTVGQMFVMDFQSFNLMITVKKVMGADPSTGEKAVELLTAVVNTEATVSFRKAAESSIRLVGENRKMASTSVINPDWNFENMGIGGLDNEFSGIFRRAFASRVFPPELIEEMGIQHVKGILLYGPPGTGKTLMARQIGKMLNARAPKIVNGPEILSKYVGESEKNIRELFEDAEKEEKEKGPESGLHIVIFDEIDAICKQRGSHQDGTGVHDTVVNQLLSKMDGVDQLNNVLVIGMTNRKDLIDEALLRPGRLEVQMEISLPDEHGRVQILKIHTANLRENKRIAADVDLEHLAKEMKNYSGAEISGVVRSATSFSMNRLVKSTGKVDINDAAREKLKVTLEDFENAILEVKPAFGGVEDGQMEQYLLNGIIPWSPMIDRLRADARLVCQQVENSTRTPRVSVLLEGAPGAGKTALAAQIATDSGFPFVKIVSSEQMVGFSESSKMNAINKVFEKAYKSPLSCVIVDDIERLIDYTPVGPRFSNAVLQTLLVLIKKGPPKGRKLLVLATSSSRNLLQQLDMIDSFDTVLHLPNITALDQCRIVLKETNAFDDEQWQQFEASALTMKVLHGSNSDDAELNSSGLYIGIKKLLMLIEMALQADDPVEQLLLHLQEDCVSRSLAPPTKK